MKFSKTEVKLFITFLIIYTLFIHWSGWDDDSRFVLTRSIVENNTLSIDDYYRFTGDRAYYQGHYYSDKAPGMSFLGVPIYTLSKLLVKGYSDPTIVVLQGSELYFDLTPSPFVHASMFLMIFFISVLPSALSTVLLFRISGFFLSDDKLRLFVAVIYGSGTTAMPYASVFFEQGISVFLALFLVYKIFNMRYRGNMSPKELATLGILAGASVIVSYLNAFALVGVFVYMIFNRNVFHRRGLLLFAIFSFIGVFPLFVYNFIVFGSPLSLGYFYLRYPPSINIERPPFALQVLASHDNPVYTFFSSLFDLRFESLLYHAVAIANLLFSPIRGLFFFYPVLLFSLPGLFLMRKKHKPELWMIFTVLITTLWITTLPVGNWYGGTSFGPRFLAIAVALLMIPFCVALGRSTRIWRLAVIALLLISVFHNVAGLQPFSIVKPDNVDEKYNINVASVEGYNYSFVTYNVLYDYYVPKLIEGGPRSYVIENIVLGVHAMDIRNYYKNFEPRVTEIKLFTLPPFGIFLFESKVIPVLILVVTILFIWAPSALKIKTLLFLSIFSVIFISVEPNVLFSGGWYNKAQGDDGVWMAKDGTIYAYSNRSGQFMLNFSAISYEKPYWVGMYVNGMTIGNFTVRPFMSAITTERFNFSYGENMIRFYADGCVSPRELNKSGNIRCLSIKIRGLEWTDVISENSIIYAKNWYMSALNASGRWMAGDGLIYLYSNHSDKFAFNMSIASFSRPYNVDMYLNGKLVDDFIVNPFISTVITDELDIVKGENTVMLYSSGCISPFSLNRSNDRRCLNINVHNFDKITLPGTDSVIYAKNWYAPDANGRWMSDDSMVYIIREKNATLPVKVILSSYKADNVSFTFNGKLVKNFKVNSKVSTISLDSFDFNKGLNRLQITTESGCHIIPSTGNPNNTKCISLFLHNLTVDG